MFPFPWTGDCAVLCLVAIVEQRRESSLYNFFTLEAILYAEVKSRQKKKRGNSCLYYHNNQVLIFNFFIRRYKTAIVIFVFLFFFSKQFLSIFNEQY